MKKVLLTLIAIVSALCFVTGCANTNGNENQGGAEAPAISLNYETLSLYPYESENLVVTTELLGEKVWDSSVPSVATVDQNGVVKAIKQGSAVITVTIGSETAKCFVTVNKETQVPKFEFANVIDNQIGLLVGGTFSLNEKIKVTFKGADVEDAVVTISSSDDEIIEIVDGVITAKKAGSAEIIVLGEWREFDGSILNERITVKVRNDFTFELIVPEIEIYGVSNLGGKQFNTTLTVQPQLSLNGNEVTEGFEFSTEDESVAVVDQNGVVTGKSAGKTNVVCKYFDQEEIIIKKEITIKYAVTDYQPQNEIIFVQSKDKTVGEFDGIFDSGIKIVKIGDITDVNEKMISVGEDGKLIAGSEGFVSGERIYRVYNSVYAYDIPVVMADVEISTAEQFRTLFEVKAGDERIENYVVLDADIQNVGVIENEKAKHLFGTINGNGHVVSGLIVKQRALIEESYGVIKNIAFVNASQQTYKDSNDLVLNCATLVVNNCGIIDNVFLQTDMVGGSALTLINSANGIIKNVIVSAEWDTERELSAYKSASTGGLFTYCNGGNGSITNIYGLSRSNGNNYGIGWSSNAQSKPYANSNILLSILENGGLNGFNSFWKIIDGELYFADTPVIQKSSTISFELPSGQRQLFAFSKSVEGPIATTYGSNYYKGGHCLELPIDVGGVNSVEFISTDGSYNVVKPALAGYDPATKIIKFGWASINATPVGDYEIIIYAENGNAYSSNIVVADFVVFDKAEFLSMMATYDKQGAAAKYIALGADIDFGGETFTNTNIDANAITFSGTFDGRGYAIKNIKVGSYGIFGYLGSSGVIKNVALINASQVEIGGSLLVAYSWAGTIENVFVQGTTGGIGGILYNDNGSTVKVKNCIAIVDSTNSGNWGLDRGAVVANASNGSKANAQYNYAISSNFAGSFGTDSTNLYTSTSGLLTALNGQLPSGFNSYWSFNANGELCFGNNVVIAKQ